ncbi:MAG: hypothetical protein ACR2PZ_18145, partial [Pseudomonadales bacterium]
MSKLSIKTKLLVMLLGVSAISIAVVASLNYIASYEALRDSVFMHLTSVRASKADALEQYFERMQSETRVVASSPNLSIMATEFADALAELESVELTAEKIATLEKHYRDEYLPSLDAMVDGTPEFEAVFPASNAARYLQYHYIASSPYPSGNKMQLDDSQDGSTYSKIHAQWHPVMRHVLKEFGYYDLFLIDMSSGRIVYTTAKEIDFATSLISGPHAQSNLARLFRSVQRNPDRDAARMIDFE